MAPNVEKAGSPSVEKAGSDGECAPCSPRSGLPRRCDAIGSLYGHVILVYTIESSHLIE